jgi:hypothetical protein
MDQYITLGIYVGMLFTVVLGGLFWNKYREDLKRRFNLLHYRHPEGDDRAHATRSSH